MDLLFLRMHWNFPSPDSVAKLLSLILVAKLLFNIYYICQTLIQYIIYAFSGMVVVHLYILVESQCGWANTLRPIYSSCPSLIQFLLCGSCCQTLIQYTLWFVRCFCLCVIGFIFICLNNVFMSVILNNRWICYF